MSDITRYHFEGNSWGDVVYKHDPRGNRAPVSTTEEFVAAQDFEELQGVIETLLSNRKPPPAILARLGQSLKRLCGSLVNKLVNKDESFDDWLDRQF